MGNWHLERSWLGPTSVTRHLKQPSNSRGTTFSGSVSLGALGWWPEEPVLVVVLEEAMPALPEPVVPVVPAVLESAERLRQPVVEGAGAWMAVLTSEAMSAADARSSSSMWLTAETQRLTLTVLRRSSSEGLGASG